MKLLKVILIVIVTTTLWGWINQCGSPLTLADLIPFSRSGHSFDYNYTSLVMIGLAVWAIGRVHGRKKY
jgi:hypothetical protein